MPTIKLTNAIVSSAARGTKFEDAATPTLLLIGGRTRYAGLGSIRHVTLTDVRATAGEVLRLLKVHGIDPVDARRAARAPAVLQVDAPLSQPHRPP